MDINDLLLTAVRATIVYLGLLFVVRMLGKREVGNVSAIDLLVALMLGEVTDEIVYGDVTLVKGFVAVGVIAAWHMVNAWASHKSKTIDKLTSDSAATVVEHGKIEEQTLAKERVSKDELMSLLRLQGIEDLAEVKQAMLETTGQLSVLKEEWAKPVQKGDLDGKRKPERQQSAA